ncbi:MAG: hypothetical protein D3903_06185 [Candidatus Electrothrix sp. GM3_4]|nr:hypothetical protein [Candidatus Electrothrix sp. GM3_4]
MATPDEHYFHPYMLVILILLRTAALEIFHQYALEEGRAKEAVEYLKNQKGGVEFLGSHTGIIVEAYLISGKTYHDESKEFLEYQAAVKDSKLEQKERIRSEKVVKIVKEISWKGRAVSVSNLVEKLELAAQFK